MIPKSRNTRKTIDSGWGVNLADVTTMTKKENQSKGGNNSLLQTARTKNYGAGKYALLAIKSRSQPSSKKVVVNGEFIDSRLKVSGITAADIQRSGKQNDDGTENISSMLGIGSPLENSKSKSYSSGPGTNVAGSGDYAVQSTTFFSLWPASTSAGSSNIDHHHKHHHQHQQHQPLLLQNQLKSKKFVKSTTPGRKKATVTRKKTMDISKGLRFSAPAPMTLNRYQPQMGQEKTAPESKEYLEMKTRIKQKQKEAKHMAEAKITIEERLKQAFGLDEIDARIDQKINDFDNENMNAVGNKSMEKISLMKKILGKVRPKPSNKCQKKHGKSSAIQAAMAAAAAAVEAATGNPSGTATGRNRAINEEEARAIVSQALLVSRQKKKPSSMHELLDDMFRPSTIDMNHQEMATQEIDELGRQLHFPVNEVMMKLNEDSVSDLDASIRNSRKIPVTEIHMNNSNQFHGNESVSTLGTPRVFEQLDKLLLSEPHRLQQRSGLIQNFFEDNMGGSASPRFMVTSNDSRALIDQLDSGTLVGDMTAGTARAENAVQFCNIASNCFEHKSLFMDTSARHRILESNITVPDEEESFDDSETSNREETSNGETWPSPAPAFTQAIDNAIRRAEIQLAASHKGHHTKDGSLSPIGEVGAGTSAIASPYDNEGARTKSKSLSTSPQIAPTSSHLENLQLDQPENFDSFMNIAESKLHNVTETIRDNKYATEFDQSQNEKPNIKAVGRHTNKTNGDVSEKKKSYAKNRGVGATNEVSMMDEGRFLLEKDDAYWDTLSTIASTTNDQSTESDAYMAEFVQPGPIPGEITTSSSELKSVASPVVNGEGSIETNQHLEHGFLSQKGGNLHEMMNDVADLIDSELLDNLPIIKSRRSNIAVSLKLEKDSDTIEGIQNLSMSNRKMSRTVSNQTKPYPEAVERSKVEENRSGNLASAASQIAKGIRSVSWGFEEIYEDQNPHLDISDQDTDNSGSSYSMSRASRPYPEGMHRSHRRAPHSDTQQPGFEEDLLSRTLEMSKGLLETIMGSQLVHENKYEKQELHNVGSDDSREVEYDESALGENPISTESRDDFHHDEKSREDDFSPTINSRLESLRNQRTRALSKFRQSQTQTSISQPNQDEIIVVEMRDRERLKQYSSSHEYAKFSSKERDHAEYYIRKKAVMKQSYSANSDIVLKYTTSDSNASTTPSQKARDLRMQLDEAMRASREIQISQNELGNELNSFKRRYYKNPDIQANHATTNVHGF